MNNVAHATVTETAILKSQIRDLKQNVQDLEHDRDSLDTRLQKADKTLSEVALVLAAQEGEIHQLRRQVKALRDGAILDDEP
jgi:chromosome segregation ATPase